MHKTENSSKKILNVIVHVCVVVTVDFFESFLLNRHDFTMDDWGKPAAFWSHTSLGIWRGFLLILGITTL